MTHQGALMGWLHPDGTPWGDDLGAYDPAAVARTVHALRWLYGGWMTLDARGWEHVPAGPVLLVSNHSGGTSVPDAWGFAMVWYRRYGGSRPLVVLAHELIFALKASGTFAARRGVLRADPAVARAALQDGRDVLVMPGGDLEAWRPYADRYRVSFGGRTGYARLALEERVPIVPVAHAGAHETLVVLSSGYRLARAAGLHRVARAEILPLHLSLPWGLGIGPVPHFPAPARLRWRLGEGVDARERLRPGESVPEDLVTEVDATVRARIQAQLDALRAERDGWPERAADGLRAAAARLRPRR